jgi:thioredoxin reductase (NADPH)
MDHYDVIVIGQGFSGLTAAKLSAERGLSTANFEAEMFGGLVVNINELDPGPSGWHGSGVDLVSELAMTNLDAGIAAVSAQVTALSRGSDGLWRVSSSEGEYSARHVIVASGARFRELGIPGERELVGRGVSHCADCDGPLFMGKQAIVIGGGDSGFQEALTLAGFCSKVTMVYRTVRARADLVARVEAQATISQLSGAEPVAILGDDSVSGLRIARDGAETVLEGAGVFIFAGLVPNADFVPIEVQRDGQGALVVDRFGQTTLAGLWAVGAVRAGYGGALEDAAADAARVVDALAA